MASSKWNDCLAELIDTRIVEGVRVIADHTGQPLFSWGSFDKATEIPAPVLKQLSALMVDAQLQQPVSKEAGLSSISLSDAVSSAAKSQPPKSFLGGPMPSNWEDPQLLDSAGPNTVNAGAASRNPAPSRGALTSVLTVPLQPVSRPQTVPSVSSDSLFSSFELFGQKYVPVGASTRMAYATSRYRRASVVCMRTPFGMVVATCTKPHRCEQLVDALDKYLGVYCA